MPTARILASLVTVDGVFSNTPEDGRSYTSSSGPFRGCPHPYASHVIDI